MTLEQLNAEYGSSIRRYVEITDRSEIEKQLASQTSCCWLAGSKIGTTEWIQLCSDGDVTFVYRELDHVHR
jgi:hypothetical protein